MSAALLGLLGFGMGLGVLLVVAGWRRPGAGEGEGSSRRRLARSGARRAHAGRWALAATAAGLAALVLTRWPVAGPLAAAAVWFAPRLTSGGGGQRETELIEAIAGWAEMLQGTLAAGAGLEQTITATAGTAPDAIRPHVQALAEAIAEGEELAPALRRLAEALADATADLVISVLILSAQHQARQLAPRLAALAETARSQVEMRRRVAAAQARVRTTVRIVAGTTAVFVGGMVLFNRAFLTPYDSPGGQVMLLVIAAIIAVALVWLARLTRIEQPARFLTPSTIKGGEER
ncbi:type II secretion system F family protein [Streptomyces sp. DSM 44917]|uniref:Type II secretion system F family protein n=1 Tax=Streptomyces boetiae TaxID=3075541 RepID=A0ABU2L6S7_9ACTN|nr:type II secretion system F family protein [Streptomyces sp. DSM 44917]MDT0307270.1 type II secretion system F family protein [Streptomyces sp. DSM 44917]